MMKNKLIYLMILLVMWSSSCSEDEPEKEEVISGELLEATHTVQSLRSEFEGGAAISTAVVVRGIVISSDEEKNFSEELFIQDSTGALSIEISSDMIYSKFSVGSEVNLLCKGLIFNKTSNSIALEFGKIEGSELENVLFKLSDGNSVEPEKTDLSEGFKDTQIGTLVKVSLLQFEEKEIGETFVAGSYDTERTLSDKDDNEILIRFSREFSGGGDLVPEQRGSVVGILEKSDQKFKIRPRSKDDFVLNLSRILPFTKRVYEFNGNELPYQIMFPPEYDKSKTYPLVVFLHGAGERGSNNTSQMANGPRTFGSAKARKEYPAIVIFPQCPSDVMWSRRTKVMVDNVWVFDFPVEDEPNYAMEMVINLVKSLQEEEAVDDKRIYVSGLSMGGIGTFEFVYYAPEIPAAVLSMAGGHDPVLAADYADKVSFRLFHGARDNVVPPKYSREMVQKLGELNADVKYTEEPTQGHTWNYALNDPEYLEWMFSKSKE